MLEVIGDARLAISLMSVAHDREVTVAFINQPSPGSRFKNLDEAIEVASTGRPVLLLSPLPPYELASDRRYHIAMSYPGVRHETLPLSKNHLLDIIDEMIETGPTRPDNPLVRAVYSAMESSQSDYAPLTGQTFDAICCSVDGVIVCNDGSINTNMLRLLEDICVDRPLLLWTGDDLDAIEQRLREAEIATPLIPKKFLRGATVMVAFDVIPQEDLVATYGINVVTYHRVP